MTPKRIGILSIANDLHSLIIQYTLNQHDDVLCDVIETDRLAASPVLSWRPASLQARLPARNGNWVDPSTLDAIWWRRANYPQLLPPTVTGEAEIDLINNDSAESVLGILLTTFSGKWISEPSATRRAENKLVQLETARALGLRIPQTLVSQDPEEIRHFCNSNANRVIIKPVRGTHKQGLLTTEVTAAHLASPKALALSPAIFQELIPGSTHVRAQCFGSSVYPFFIESSDLDWRWNIDRPMSFGSLPTDVAAKLLSLVAALGLRMAIIDLKRNDEGEFVFLEVNAQGQFLFMQGMTGFDLANAFAAFLRQEAGTTDRRS
jgi:hypothetical protein